MQFAFTEEQELLRREAREVLANGGWGRDELDELGFLDRAVVFEEAGRANRGDEFFDSEAPENERLAALALEAAGIARRALELGVEHAKTREQFGRPIGVYQAVSHPLADTYVDTELARSIAYWAAWCVAEADEQAPIAAAAAKSYAGDVAVAAVGGEHQGAHTIRLRIIRVGSGLQQQRRGLGVAGPGGEQQRRGPAPQHGVVQFFAARPLRHFAGHGLDVCA